MDEEKTISAEVTKEKKGKPDRYLVGVYITLLIFGIIEAFSASSREIAVAGNIYEPIAKHILFLLIGTVLMIWISKKEVTQFIKPSLIFVGLTFVSLIVTMFFGSSVNGAQRGFSLLGFTVQPAELSKVAIVFILAYILAITMNKNWNHYLRCHRFHFRLPLANARYDKHFAIYGNKHSHAACGRNFPKKTRQSGFSVCRYRRALLRWKGNI